MPSLLEKLEAYARQVRGAGEVGASMLSGVAAEPIAGLRGLLSLAEGDGVAAGAGNVERTRDKLTYAPRSPEGQQQMRALGSLMAPLLGAVEKGKRTLGDGALKATGSPGLAAAAYSAPDAILAALGARPAMAAANAGMRRVGPPLKAMANRSAGTVMGSPVSQIGAIGHWKDSPEALRMTKAEFIGSPKITKASNADSLRPKALTTVQGAPDEPFMGRYSARYSPDGAAVYDGDKVIASYNFGDTLVVDRPYRKGGIGSELVYEWRTRYPAHGAATARTKVSQAIQGNVWDRIQREMREGE